MAGNSGHRLAPITVIDGRSISLRKVSTPLTDENLCMQQSNSISYNVIMTLLSRLLSVYWLPLLLGSVLVAYNPTAHALTSAEEYEIKAVFLYGLTKFIRWPDKAIRDPNQFNICILGQDPFEEDLDLAVKNEKILGRSIQILRYQRARQTQHCQVLFISTSERLRFTEIFRFLQYHPILTVGDSPDFIDKGGMVRFVKRNNKVRLSIDPQAIEAVRLKADANLLRIAEIANPSNQNR